MDHEIKHVEEVGIISRSMSDWASPILMVPRKQNVWMPAPTQVVVKMVNSTSGCVLTIETQ